MNKTQRQKSEYNKMLSKHNTYKKDLTKLLEGKKFCYTAGDGVDNEQLKISQNNISEFVYLAKKIHNTDPMRVYTTSTIQLEKYQKQKQQKLEQQQLKQQKLEQEEAERLRLIEENSDIASEDRYSILDSDSDSE